MENDDLHKILELECENRTLKSLVGDLSDADSKNTIMILKQADEIARLKTALSDYEFINPTHKIDLGDEIVLGKVEVPDYLKRQVSYDGER